MNSSNNYSISIDDAATPILRWQLLRPFGLQFVVHRKQLRRPRVDIDEGQYILTYLHLNILTFLYNNFHIM